MKTKCSNCHTETVNLKSHMGQEIYYCPYCHLKMIDLEQIVAKKEGYDKLLKSVRSVRMINYEKIVRRILKFFEKRNNIKGFEIGCAEGWFMEVAEKAEICMAGIEPMAGGVLRCKEKGLNVLDGFFPDDMEEIERPYDFIVFNDVFEHIPSSRRVLEACKNMLTDDEIIVINLPVTSGFVYRCAVVLDKIGAGFLMRRLFQLDTESPHLYYYNKQSLQWIARNVGLKVASHSQRMKSITFRSIKERIDAVPMKMGNMGRRILCFFCCVAYPFVSILPSDTKVFYFQKQ